MNNSTHIESALESLHTWYRVSCTLILCTIALLAGVTGYLFYATKPAHTACAQNYPSRTELEAKVQKLTPKKVSSTCSFTLNDSVKIVEALSELLPESAQCLHIHTTQTSCLLTVQAPTMGQLLDIYDVLATKLNWYTWSLRCLPQTGTARNDTVNVTFTATRPEKK